MKPGRYTIALVKVVDKNATTLGEPQVCEVVPLIGAAVAVQP